MKNIKLFIPVLVCLALCFFIFGCGNATGGGGGGGGTTRPTVTATNPTNEAAGVPLNSQIRITFSKAMNPVSTEAAFKISPSATGSFTWEANTLILTPTGNLSYATTYVVTIEATAKSLAGTSMASPYTFSFITASHTIGESYGGGIIFYVDDTGQHGLIAARADNDTGIQWYNGSNITTEATGEAVGTGQTNTAAIITAQGAGSYAASICDEYSTTEAGVTYDDWFLPSKDELNLLFLQKSVVGGFITTFYWSSTEHATQYNKAWHQYFVSGVQEEDIKSNPGYVRAVRAF